MYQNMVSLVQADREKMMDFYMELSRLVGQLRKGVVKHWGIHDDRLVWVVDPQISPEGLRRMKGNQQPLELCARSHVDGGLTIALVINLVDNNYDVDSLWTGKPSSPIPSKPPFRVFNLIRLYAKKTVSGVQLSYADEASPNWIFSIEPTEDEIVRCVSAIGQDMLQKYQRRMDEWAHGTTPKPIGFLVAAE